MGMDVDNQVPEDNMDIDIKPPEDTVSTQELVIPSTSSGR
jgi:hypothetical protein